MARSHSESVAINTGSGFILMTIGMTVSFFVRTVFINTLGAEYAGMSTLFADILSMLSLAELGISTAITFALYKPIREGDERRIGALMSFYKKAYRLIAAFVFVVGMSLIPFLHLFVKTSPNFNGDIRLIFAFFIVNSSASYLLAYKQTLIIASEKRYVISNTGIWFTLVRTVLECLVLWYLHNYILYLLVGLADAVLRNYVIARKADKMYPALSMYADEKISREEMKRLFKDVGALSLYKVCQVALTSTDSMIISSVPALGMISVGYLGNYRMVYNTINTAVNQFYNAFIPSLGSMAVHSSDDHQHKVFQTTNFLSFWAMCFCCTSLFCLSVPFVSIIWLQKVEFVLPMDIIVVLTLNFYTSAMMRPTNAFRNSNGLFLQGKFRPVWMAFFNIAMDIWFVRWMGIFGVLLSTSIARLITQTWYDPWLLYRRVFKRPVGQYYKQYMVYALLTALSCVLTYELCWLTEAIQPYALRFLCMMLLCVVVPNALVILLFRDTESYRDVVGRFKTLTARIKKELGKRFKALTARIKNALGKRFKALTVRIKKILDKRFKP